ncbi:MAG: hypothetical protein DSY43_02805 [Gammaproteobacteria bacterium]|nr:MAG: hypothetical protein DSY43_02805 [Gammaproteobacteria bacterium]
MPIKIEQITKTGSVVSDYDEKLKPNEIKLLLSKQKYIEIKSNKNPYIVKYKNKDINLYVKNITYLGRKKDKLGNYDDWEHYKKRIQIGENFKPISKQKNTLLLGVYHYDNANVFCIFDKQSYENSSANNASAHIHTMDILKAKELSLFEKTDKKGNNIIVFTEQNFEKAFDVVLSNKKTTLSKEINIFNEFSNTLNANWLGVDCYIEMMNNNFNLAYLGEWAGYYLEYKFDEFLRNNPGYQDICQYVQNKEHTAIDLDLWFEEKQFYGDLKAHGVDRDLIGNDKTNINEALRQYNKVWYIVFSHSTIKDKDKNGLTTEFWNKKINERYEKTGKGKFKKLDSYLSRMKHSVILDNFAILEINQFNKKYLVDFKQGKNSNGAERKIKISIKKKDIENDNFVIYRKKI